jgi:hypothetical protein
MRVPKILVILYNGLPMRVTRWYCAPAFFVPCFLCDRLTLGTGMGPVWYGTWVVISLCMLFEQDWTDENKR